MDATIEQDAEPVDVADVGDPNGFANDLFTLIRLSGVQAQVFGSPADESPFLRLAWDLQLFGNDEIMERMGSVMLLGHIEQASPALLGEVVVAAARNIRNELLKNTPQVIVQ